MEEYIEIGKLNIEVLSKYYNIKTDRLIITKERIYHINKRHRNDYDLYGKYILNIINEPDYILEDLGSENTVLYLKSIQELKLQIVIKIQTENDGNKANSIITFWHMRKRSYNKIIDKNKKIFEKLDKNE